MKTRLIDDIQEAVDIIRSGGLVAVPTETVYGLAANALSEDAVRALFMAKGRPESKPLSILVGGAADIDRYSQNAPSTAHTLADAFWPGPLTIVLNSTPDIPEIVRASGTTIGLRCPDHSLTLELIRQAGCPLAAPSANPSGMPSPKSADEVLGYFCDNVDGVDIGVIDGGVCGIGKESTVIDLSSQPYKILRHGALSEDAIAACLVDTLHVIGITGGSGSGKSTALEILRDMDALVLDCDVIYHELLETSADMLAEIAERFDGVVADGKLQRKQLGEIVFSDQRALMDLNRITHKYVSVEVNSRLRNWALSGGQTAAIDAIALLESGIADRCTAVVGLLADRDLRIGRIVQREGVTAQYAEKRVDAQKSDAFFVENCTHILYNNGEIDEFRQRCAELFQTLAG